MIERLPPLEFQYKPRRYAFGDVISSEENSEWPQFIEWANIYLDKRLGLSPPFVEVRKLGHEALSMLNLHSFPGWEDLLPEPQNTLPDLLEEPLDYGVIGKSLWLTYPRVEVFLLQ